MQNEANAAPVEEILKCSACGRLVQVCQDAASCWDHQQALARLADLRRKGGRRTWQERAEYETLLRRVAR
jgi:hypothetical protein